MCKSSILKRNQPIFDPYQVYINIGTGVGKDEKHGVDFAHKKVSN